MVTKYVPFIFQSDNFEEENELLPEDFLIQEFQKAIGVKFNKETQLQKNGIEAVEQEFKNLFNGYAEKFPESKEWPLNMSDIKKGEIFSEIPQMDEKDKKQFNELGQKIFEHKMNTFSNRVQMNKDALANWWEIFTLFHFESYCASFKRFKSRRPKFSSIFLPCIFNVSIVLKAVGRPELNFSTYPFNLYLNFLGSKLNIERNDFLRLK